MHTTSMEPYTQSHVLTGTTSPPPSLQGRHALCASPISLQTAMPSDTHVAPLAIKLNAVIMQPYLPP